jgi:hypothetical protein
MRKKSWGKHYGNENKKRIEGATKLKLDLQECVNVRKKLKAKTIFCFYSLAIQQKNFFFLGSIKFSIFL